MSDIFTPASLTGADAAKGILEQLERLGDPKTRERIEADILAAHKLNDTEAAKHAAAISLIERHTSILNDTRKISEQIEQAKKDLEKKTLESKAEIAEEQVKLSVKRDLINSETKKAENLLAEATAKHNDISTREDNLKAEKDRHEILVRQYQHDSDKLAKERADLVAFKDSVIELDRQTKEKVESLKKFNF